jgi:ubiquinone/menaquinone biosynthesis C-methylase UbiE
MPFDHFDMIAGLYDRAAAFESPVSLPDLLSLPSDGLLLDIGGGTGRAADALRSAVGWAVVVDLSRGMLHYAVEKDLPAACALAENLPFASEMFDRIIMVDALHHVFDQHKTVLELWRILAPGGRIVIIEPDIHKFSAKLIAIAEKILLMRSHFLSGEEIVSLFAKRDAKVRVLSDKFNILVGAEKVR